MAIIVSTIGQSSGVTHHTKKGDFMTFSLKAVATKLEDGIIVISGPALAISGIIAGVDLVTGGNILKSQPLFTLVWAVTLLLTLDFQVLALGVRAHRIYLSDKGRGQKICEVVLVLIVAAAISFVSIQMQSIIARVNAEGISIDAAAAQLGISMIALTWERSTLVLFLIFMSGFLRDEGKSIAPAQPLASSLQSVSESLPEQNTAPLQVPQIAASRFESKEQAILDALAANPDASDEELADIAQTSKRTAIKWKKRLEVPGKADEK
jgi:hypothetical protein